MEPSSIYSPLASDSSEGEIFFGEVTEKEIKLREELQERLIKLGIEDSDEEPDSLISEGTLNACEFDIAGADTLSPLTPLPLLKKRSNFIRSTACDTPSSSMERNCISEDNDNPSTEQEAELSSADAKDSTTERLEIGDIDITVPSEVRKKIPVNQRKLTIYEIDTSDIYCNVTDESFEKMEAFVESSVSSCDTDVLTKNITKDVDSRFKIPAITPAKKKLVDYSNIVSPIGFMLRNTHTVPLIQNSRHLIPPKSGIKLKTAPVPVKQMQAPCLPAKGYRSAKKVNTITATPGWKLPKTHQNSNPLMVMRHESRIVKPSVKQAPSVEDSFAHLSMHEADTSVCTVKFVANLDRLNKENKRK